MDFNRLNAHTRDNIIEFDPDAHVYTLRGEVYDSVTTVVDGCFEKFDAEYWAARKATPDAPKEALLEKWERAGRLARDLGTLMHDRIERHYLGESLPPDVMSDPTFALFAEFARARRLRPYRTEWRIFHEDSRIAGTLDFLAFDGERFSIYDWKRSTKVTDPEGRPVVRSSFGKTALPPLGHLPDTAYWHYALQVSIYRYILEQKYGIVVSDSFLGVFHPDRSRPHLVELPYLRDEVITLLQTRSR